MQNIVFIDLEVNPEDGKVLDFGAVKSDGGTLHTKQRTDFENFISNADFICGHNICHHDSKYFARPLGAQHIDTLYLSPLLFPQKPYHHLVKDDKIISDDLSNPLNDAIKARELFFDEINAFGDLETNYKQLLVNLLFSKDEFRGFFAYMCVSPSGNTYQLIEKLFKSKICLNSPLDDLIQNSPIQLAYSLAIITINDKSSIIPSWVYRQFPFVETVLRLLRNTPCSGCEYCNDILDPRKHLKRIFGFDNFRTYNDEPLQESAINSAVRNESLLAIFPTGGGKSLTFQLPALMAGITQHALTVVISPLQSLMKDQVDNLERRGIADSVTINGLLSPLERQEAIERVESGVASLLYISPESLRSKTIEALLLKRQIARFVIDEAHCFSAWGHDFRVDYLYIGDYIKELARKKGIASIPISCFTATAKQKVISDIKDYFKEKLGADLRIFATNASRTNLRYQVLFKETDEEKYATLRDLIESKKCPTIVYVSRTKRTIELAKKLTLDGIAALPFNGKMESNEKQKNQDEFIGDRVQVMVATSAFGMGVDKSNVKLVVHYDISDSLENYVQEAGRAGRDPHIEAECYVLYNDDDLDKHFILNNQTKITCAEINQVWRAIKNLTKTRKSFCSSALEIAREAGWDYEVSDVETRVKTALLALENANYIQRGNNSAHVYATSILAKNYDEAANKIDASTLFTTEDSKKYAKRIVKSLISSKYTYLNDNCEAESRIDYLADILGITKENVIDAVQTMRHEKILKDDRDISAFINSPHEAKKIIDEFKKLTLFIADRLSPDGITLNLKQLNEEAENNGITSNVKNIKTILLFLKIKSYIRLTHDASSDSVVIQLLIKPQLLDSKLKKMFSVAASILRYLLERYKSTPQNNNGLILFSIIELLEDYNNSLFDDGRADVSEIEDAILFLAKINSMRLEGGFLVIYMGLNISRLNFDKNKQYTKEDYRQLEEFYQHKIEQIHIVGEFANMMVRDYNAALGFVNDYFKLDYKPFLSKYFNREQLKEIERNITPKRYKNLFETLSEKQKQIIDDNLSPHIVVAAGPGSGKTKVLVHKLASLLLLEDVKHEQLLMLTFSRAAALEFKSRLTELIGNAAKFVEIKTFHSYCFDLVGQIGKIEEAGNIVARATEMINNHEVEQNKITKKVLVIDEAQDMDLSEFALVEALISNNDNLRVIAVGDDDQNIYQFRGSSSEYFASMVGTYNAKYYELTDNYRSSNQIVDFANYFAASISRRMKHTPIVSKVPNDGKVILTRHNSPSGFENAIVDDLTNNYKEGTCAVLTATNQEALSVVGLLRKKGIRAKLIQSNDGFDLGKIAEMRFFVKIVCNNLISPKISDEIWDKACESLNDAYAESSCLDLCNDILRSFKDNYKDKYLTDFKVFLSESALEDFIKTEKSVVLVSTIHKAKGREFDHVFMYLNNLNINNDEEKRQLYVGFTRAKKLLSVHYNMPSLDFMSGNVTEFRIDNTQYEKPELLTLSLMHQDVVLSFFKDKKERILRLRSGAKLSVYDNYLLYDNYPVAKLSKTSIQKLLDCKQLGYEPVDARIRFVVAWYCKDDNMEYAIILPDILLARTTQ